MRRTQTSGPPSLDFGIHALFADAALCIIDKPAGLLSASLPGQDLPSAFAAVKAYATAKSGRPRGATRGPDRQVRNAWIVHRLDREVSGVMVFALSTAAFAALKDELKARRVQRRYVALVEGVVKEKEGTVASFLADAGPGKPVRSSEHPPVVRPEEGEEEGDPARRAVTHWTRLCTANNYSLLEVRLETGRKHQIRAHLAQIGHPIAGDALYGAATNPLKRVGLHAYTLSLAHPTTGKPLHFHSPVPERFLKTVGASDAVLGRSVLIHREGAPRGSALPPMEAPAATEHPASKPQGGPMARPPARAPAETGWDNVAGWYDDLLARRGSDHHDELVLPGVVRLLDPKPGQRVLDLACGQGDLCLRLARLGCEAVGVDAAPRLIEAAGRHAATELPRQAPTPRFLVGDALRLGDLKEIAPGSFDSAACVLALMNMDPLAPVLRGVARLLKPGARFVAVTLHPAFRIPKQSAWGHAGTGRNQTMYRRVDGYLSPASQAIVMNPGQVAQGAAPITTTTWHRPLEAYAKALTDAGLVIDGLEEWASRRESEPGPKAHEENRIRREIPMFLALCGRKAPAPQA